MVNVIKDKIINGFQIIVFDTCDSLIKLTHGRSDTIYYVKNDKNYSNIAVSYLWGDSEQSPIFLSKRTEDILFFNNKTEFPATGSEDSLYIDNKTKYIHEWVSDISDYRFLCEMSSLEIQLVTGVFVQYKHPAVPNNQDILLNAIYKVDFNGKTFLSLGSKKIYISLDDITNFFNPIDGRVWTDIFGDYTPPPVPIIDKNDANYMLIDMYDSKRTGRVDLSNDTLRFCGKTPAYYEAYYEEKFNDIIANAIKSGSTIPIDSGNINSVLIGDVSSLSDVNIVSAIKKDRSSILDIIVNPKNYGAKCNGTEDDTPAYVAALNYCSSIGGGVVLIPIGTSVVSSLTIPSYCGLIGNGRSSVLKQKDHSTAPIITIETDSTKFTYIRDFSIDGNKANQTSSNAKGLLYNNSTQFVRESKLGEWDARHVASNIYIANTKGIGFETSGRGESHFSHIQVRGSDDYGMKLNAFDNWYDGLSSGDNARTGMYVTMGSRFTNCKSWNNGNATDNSDGYGWYISASSASFACCEAQGNYNDGFYFTNSSNCVGTGLISDVNGQHASTFYAGKSGYRINDSCIISINGTTRNIDSITSQDYGVVLSGWSTDNVIDVVCSNMKIKPFFMIDNPVNEIKNYLCITNGINSKDVMCNGKFNYVGVNTLPNSSLASLVASGVYGNNISAAYFQQTMDANIRGNVVGFQAIDKDNSANSVTMSVGANIKLNETFLISNGSNIRFDSNLKLQYGTWSSSHLLFGSYHVWMNANGNLMCKYGVPTSDNDGYLIPKIVPVPATSTSIGNTNDMAIDSNYIYVCVATNTWRRIALSTW